MRCTISSTEDVFKVTSSKTCLIIVAVTEKTQTVPATLSQTVFLYKEKALTRVNFVKVTFTNLLMLSSVHFHTSSVSWLHDITCRHRGAAAPPGSSQVRSRAILLIVFILLVMYWMFALTNSMYDITCDSMGFKKSGDTADRTRDL